jgi:hypothetical protein
MNQLFKKPSALIPFILTFGMLLLFALYFSHLIPPDPVGDEGTAAHLFQLWLIVDVIAVAFFALKWFPTQPRETAFILSLQIALALIPLSIVYSLHL